MASSNTLCPSCNHYLEYHSKAADCWQCGRAGYPEAPMPCQATPAEIISSFVDRLDLHVDSSIDLFKLVDIINDNLFINRLERLTNPQPQVVTLNITAPPDINLREVLNRIGHSDER